MSASRAGLRITCGYTHGLGMAVSYSPRGRPKDRAARVGFRVLCAMYRRSPTIAAVHGRAELPAQKHKASALIGSTLARLELKLIWSGMCGLLVELLLR